jgi:hypothetical protein
MFVSQVLHGCARAVRAAIDVLVIQPLQGLTEILAGAAQAGPELVLATTSAIVQAVEHHLGPDGQFRVEHGGGLLLAGAQRMLVPAAMALGVWLCWNPGIVFLTSAAWVLVLVSVFAV